MIRNYRDLIVWQKSMELAVETYRLSRGLPVEERFGITAQLRRAAAAIPANLAEGRERRSRGDFRRSVAVARGSLAELETHLELVHRLDYVPSGVPQALASLVEEVGKMLTSLLARLSSGPRRRSY
ncbi:MAG TPA: four helix bundle protein [Gemmatimonadales bacterium]|jgi:four helix bundle protein|nr:four helix bundle protein [Gemmatimonadales bacterium]